MAQKSDSRSLEHEKREKLHIGAWKVKERVQLEGVHLKIHMNQIYN